MWKILLLFFYAKIFVKIFNICLPDSYTIWLCFKRITLELESQIAANYFTNDAVPFFGVKRHWKSCGERIKIEGNEIVRYFSVVIEQSENMQREKSEASLDARALRLRFSDGNGKEDREGRRGGRLVISFSSSRVSGSAS